MSRQRFVVTCAGISVPCDTLEQAKRKARLQERRHDKPAEIYERTEHAEWIRAEQSQGKP